MNTLTKYDTNNGIDLTGFMNSFLDDDLFREFIYFDDARQPFSRNRQWSEDADRFKLEIELPRFRKEHVNVEVVGDKLSIRAENGNNNYYTKEFILCNLVDTENISATLQDGVLSVILPKTAKSKSRQIKIE